MLAFFLGNLMIFGFLVEIQMDMFYGVNMSESRKRKFSQPSKWVAGAPR